MPCSVKMDSGWNCTPSTTSVWSASGGERIKCGLTHRERSVDRRDVSTPPPVPRPPPPAARATHSVPHALDDARCGRARHLQARGQRVGPSRQAVVPHCVQRRRQAHEYAAAVVRDGGSLAVHDLARVRDDATVHFVHALHACARGARRGRTAAERGVEGARMGSAPRSPVRAGSYSDCSPTGRPARPLSDVPLGRGETAYRLSWPTNAPRHTPRMGTRPAKCRMRSHAMPASRGAPGPGLTTMRRGRIATTSATAGAGSEDLSSAFALDGD